MRYAPMAHMPSFGRPIGRSQESDSDIGLGRKYRHSIMCVHWSTGSIMILRAV